MSSQEILALFDEAALRACLPMLILAIGLMLLLVASIASPLRGLRQGILAATLAVAAAAEVLILNRPPGLVLDSTLRADPATALWGLLFLAATALAWLYSLQYYSEDRPFQGEHDFLLLTAPVGMMLMAGAEDLLVFFVGLELLSVPLYALAAFRRNRASSVEAGIKYFLLGAFAAGLFLYGAALIYVATGTVSLVELRELGIHSALGWTGVALLAASLFFKLAIFPFHLWVPDVYQGSPTPVTVLMATGTKAAAIAFLLNASFLLPGGSAGAVALLALLTMAAGNLGALLQSDLKRMLAYSAVAHAGTLLLAVAGLLAGDPLPGGATEAALFYMGAYAFTSAGAFGLIATLERDGERFTAIESLRGLASTRPGAAAAMTLFMLSLGGIPITGGFLAKYLIFYVAVRADLIAVAVIGALLSVVALAYYLKIVVAMYMQPALPDASPPVSRCLPASVATGVCAAMVIAMGVLPQLFL
jgi:NADH-quinone oxidoreductase subunit N